MKEEMKVFRDPIYGYIYVEDVCIWDLINSSEMQRLRRIKQLGGTSFVFPGAEHTRLSHALGVYHIAKRIVDNSETNGLRINKRERLALLCAALLHDIGHGPFSHSFENILEYHHEAYTVSIIQEKATEVHQILTKIDANFPSEVASLILKTHPNKKLVSIISGPIDADRSDYLVRDAYFSGVTYGNIDIERLMRVMRFSEDRMLFKSNGVHVIEQFMLGRYHMFWQVYLHPTSISVDILLNKIVARVRALYSTGYAFSHEPKRLIPFFEQRATIDDYLMLDESVMLYYFSEWQHEKDDILSDLSSRFLNRSFFVELPYSKGNEKKVQSLLSEEAYEYYVARHQSMESIYRIRKEPVYTIDPKGRIQNVSQISPVLRAIGNVEHEEKQHKMDLLFVPREIRDQLR